MKRQRTLIGLSIVGLLLALAASPGSTPARSGLPRLGSDQAIVAAVNDLEPTTDGYRLRHPHYTATFAPDGLEFTPRDGGPTWAWHLTTVAAAAGDKSLAGIATSAVRPVNGQPLAVVYPRGRVVEQYLVKKNTIEQQFLIPQPLPLGGADLVIAGAVRSDGDFEETEDGWRWRTSDGSVRLGHVRVYDARGTVLPATMAVTAHTTRIAVDGAALAQAAYPVTVDPEIGHDCLVSNMGPYGNANYDALNPAVAYNSTNNQYLVVWSADDDVNGEFEIWGQRLNASNCNLVGFDFQISFVGPADDPAYDAEYPDVAYNSTDHEYLVVWSADHYTNGEFEIFGQRVNAYNGSLIGSMVRVSVMGPDGNASYDARDPAVAYSRTDNQYLVVWEGDTDAGSLVDGEFEIWGQLESASAEKIGPVLRLSNMGPPSDPDYDAFDPDLAYNSLNNEYLVVWEGDSNTGLLANNEFEIWGQRVSATSGELGTNDFRISEMGETGDADYDALDPAVAYNSTNNEYLVVWEGNDGGTQFNIYRQRLNAATGGEVGMNDLFVSSFGPGPNPDYNAYNPAVAYDPYNNEYLVVWQDDEMGAGEFEIWGRRLNASAWLIGFDTRLSDMGPDGNASYDAQTPAVAYSSASNNQYRVVWSGDSSPTDGEFEIWAQRFVGGYKLYLPLVVRNYRP